MVEIETIGIDIDGTKIILDKEAAKELYFKLKELFGDKEKQPITWYTYPDTYPVYPTYPNPWIYISTGINSNTTITTNGNYSSILYFS